MRSTETSGVVRGRFGLTQAHRDDARAGARVLGTARRIVIDTSPVSYAIAVAAFLCAGLFVAQDLVQALAPGLAGQQPEPQVAEASAGAFVAVAQQAGAGGAEDILQRALFAFGAAAIVSGAGYRRRARPQPQPQTRREVLGDMIASIPFGVACWSADGRLVARNERYARYLAVPETGMRYSDAVRQLAADGHMSLVGEDDSSRLIELERRDGTALLIDERPLSGGGFMTLLTDLTERKRADSALAAVRDEQRQLARRYHEEKLRAEAASRSKTAFLAHLSHDIRTPLNHIIGFADLIRHQTYGPIGDSRYLNYVETIKGSGEQLLGFFASILDLAEIESGQRQMKPEPISVDGLLEAAARRFRSQAARAGVGLVIGAPCGATLMADRFCLERMLGNIVENAVRFTAGGGKVSLAGYAAMDGVVIEVADTGIGMAADRLEAVSQAFAFGDATFTKEHTGSGLGIPIARAIAELSGGRLVIDSRPAMGTTVAISLPLEPAIEQEQAA